MAETTNMPEAYLVKGKRVTLQRIDRFGIVREQQVMVVEFKQLNLL